VVRTDISEERIASIFRAGESRRKYSEQAAATGRESRALSIYRLGEWASGNSSGGEGGFRRGRVNSETSSDRAGSGEREGDQGYLAVSDSEVAEYKGKKEPVG
jgi:hypothetical protein